MRGLHTKPKPKASFELEKENENTPELNPPGASPLLDLPMELQATIFCHLSPKDQCTLRLVSRQMPDAYLYIPGDIRLRWKAEHIAKLKFIKSVGDLDKSPPFWPKYINNNLRDAQREVIEAIIHVEEAQFSAPEDVEVMLDILYTLLLQIALSTINDRDRDTLRTMKFHLIGVMRNIGPPSRSFIARCVFMSV
jgi:F-box associated protein